MIFIGFYSYNESPIFEDIKNMLILNIKPKNKIDKFCKN